MKAARFLDTGVINGRQVFWTVSVRDLVEFIRENIPEEEWNEVGVCAEGEEIVRMETWEGGTLDLHGEDSTKEILEEEGATPVRR